MSLEREGLAICQLDLLNWNKSNSPEFLLAFLCSMLCDSWTPLFRPIGELQIGGSGHSISQLPESSSTVDIFLLDSMNPVLLATKLQPCFLLGDTNLQLRHVHCMIAWQSKWCLPPSGGRCLSWIKSHRGVNPRLLVKDMIRPLIGQENEKKKGKRWYCLLFCTFFYNVLLADIIVFAIVM